MWPGVATAIHPPPISSPSCTRRVARTGCGGQRAESIPATPATGLTAPRFPGSARHESCAEPLRLRCMGDHLGAAHGLQRRQPPRVIQVGVGDGDLLDLGRRAGERCEAAHQRPPRPGPAAIEQDRLGLRTLLRSGVPDVGVDAPNVSQAIEAGHNLDDLCLRSAHSPGRPKRSSKSLIDRMISALAASASSQPIGLVRMPSRSL